LLKNRLKLFAAAGLDRPPLPVRPSRATAPCVDEINLNVGCPSDRVQSVTFNACLMLQPDFVGACTAAMEAAVDIPMTVKCRIGVDESADRIVCSIGRPDSAIISEAG